MSNPFLIIICPLELFRIGDALKGISGYIILAVAAGIIIAMYHRNRSQNTAKMFRIVQEYQLRALNARISPHFLQNAFNFLANQYDQVDRDTIVNTIKSLSTLLRQLITNIERRVIPLEDELEFTKQYLTLKKVVFFDKFVFSIDVDENVDTFGIEIPAMLLQPILENSIKHGFREIKAGGIVTVSVRQTEHFLICEIGDNGRGLINNKPSRSEGLSWLDMTNARLRISYGKHLFRPKVIVQNLEPVGHRTIIHIPLQ